MLATAAMRRRCCDDGPSGRSRRRRCSAGVCLFARPRRNALLCCAASPAALPARRRPWLCDFMLPRAHTRRRALCRSLHASLPRAALQRNVCLLTRLTRRRWRCVAPARALLTRRRPTQAQTRAIPACAPPQ
jgi:hypothetical protein